MNLREKLALWLWPLEKRGQSVKALSLKLREERIEHAKILKRAHDAEDRFKDLIRASKKLSRKHDDSHGTMLSWTHIESVNDMP